MNNRKKNYTKEFKDQAIELARAIGTAKAAKELGVNPVNIRRWKNAIPTESSTNTELEKENRRLKRENSYLKKINDVLKKSTAIFSQDEFQHFK